jgi:uroporphyrinogen-III synthase
MSPIPFGSGWKEIPGTGSWIRVVGVERAKLRSDWVAVMSPAAQRAFEHRLKRAGFSR